MLYTAVLSKQDQIALTARLFETLKNIDFQGDNSHFWKNENENEAWAVIGVFPKKNA